MLWVYKHAPTLSDIPQDTATLLDFVNNYAKQKKKALLLHGPPGTGKTAATHALGKQQHLEIIEVNASDFRNADQIKTKIGNALKQQSLFSQGKLILIDELDGISGNKDRGGVAEIAKLITTSPYPIILTANDPWDKKFKSIRTKSKLVEYPAIPLTGMLPVLQNILSKEEKTSDEMVIKALARRSGGDLRGAITDLQVLAQANELTMNGLNTLTDREKSESIMHALVKILKSTDPATALSALDHVGENFDESILWIDENMPKEYTNPEDLSRAYEALSKADIYKGRIRKWQYWRYLVYVNALMTAGVAVAKDQKFSGQVQYKRTQRLLKMWMGKQRNARRTRVAEKLAPHVHSSIKRTVQHTVPYIKELYKRQHPSTERITEELDFDSEELEWLHK